MTGRAFDVLLHGDLVGYLLEEAAVSFRFTSDYRQMARRPVLSQSFEDDLERTYVGKRGHLPAFFENLVPEGALRDLLEDLTGVEPTDDLGLLQTVGRDLPGAVEIVSSSIEPETLPRPDEESPEPVGGITTELDGLRFSLAGVQLKFSVIREQEKLAIPAKGRHGDWIVKLDSQRYPRLVENEYATLQWAKESGFDVPECHLQGVEDLTGVARTYAPQGSVLAIRRYDRVGAQRIHQEDMCQALDSRSDLKYEHVKYEQLAYFLRVLCGDEAYEEFVRRLIFVVASGNADAHLKNWSIIYPDSMQAALAPVYDQVSTVAWADANPALRELALKLGGTKKFSQIDEAAIIRFAERAHSNPQSTLALVRESVARVAAAWRSVRSELPMPQAHVDALRAHWRRTPVLRSHADAI